MLLKGLGCFGVWGGAPTPPPATTAGPQASACCMVLGWPRLVFLRNVGHPDKCSAPVEGYSVKTFWDSAIEAVNNLVQGLLFRVRCLFFMAQG